jgi:hypothetical protein
MPVLAIVRWSAVPVVLLIAPLVSFPIQPGPLFAPPQRARVMLLCALFMRVVYCRTPPIMCARVVFSSRVIAKFGGCRVCCTDASPQSCSSRASASLEVPIGALSRLFGCHWCDPRADPRAACSRLSPDRPCLLLARLEVSRTRVPNQLGRAPLTLSPT